MISFANFETISRPGRLRAASTSQRNPSVVPRSVLTSRGTWKVEPPTRRDFTSTNGVTCKTACRNTYNGSFCVDSPTFSIAWYKIFCATLFFPLFKSRLHNILTKRLWYTGSGVIKRFFGVLLRDIFFFLGFFI